MVAQPKIAEPTVVNGINVDDLFALIEGVRRDPAKGKTSWRVTTTWDGQTRSRAQVEGFGIGGERVVRRFSIDIDESCELGGTNRFANPQEHLLAALNACMTVGYVAQCAVRGITLESLEIETEGEIDLRGFLGLDPAVAPGYEQLSYTVRIKGSGTKEEFAEIHEAVMATSPTSTTCPGPLTSNPPSSSVIDGSERRRGLQTSCVVLASNDVSLGSMLFSNSGPGCQALHNDPCGPTVLSVVGACPHDGVR